MVSNNASQDCFSLVQPLYEISRSYTFANLTHVDAGSLMRFCYEIESCQSNSTTEGKYSGPMVLIGIYISVASLFCILAMMLDLMHGFQNRKFWFPCKYFSLNTASITVIVVAMKLPVDLTSPMTGWLDQVAKVGSLAFVCTMMSNLMPSLASKNNKSLLANVIGICILVITIIVNTFIQIETRVIDHYTFYFFLFSPSFAMITYIYVCMLLFLLIILISSAITIPSSNKILEEKYQTISKATLKDQNQQASLLYSVEMLRQLVKRYWIMAETGNPQFLMASSPLSSASSTICVVSMLMYIFVVWRLFMLGDYRSYQSVYKWSVIVIAITQSIGVVVGSIAPIMRCFTILSFKSFANQNMRHFKVFEVEKYWTQKLYEWKESGISLLSCGRRSRWLLLELKNFILSLCIDFQKVVVISCKVIGLIPIMAIVLFIYCSHIFKSLKAMLFATPTVSSSEDANKDLSNYVLLLEGNMQLAEKTTKRISDSLNHLIQKAEKKQHNNLLKLLEKSVAFNGVETFDTDQIQSLLIVEPVNNWSLPIVSLTCIAIVLPNVHKDMVNSLFKGVGEGLLYTHLIEESLNKASEYLGIRRATMTLWHEVEDKCKWLGNTLERSAYDGKTPIEIIESFAHIAEETVNTFLKRMNGEPVEKENLPPNIIVANSMYRIAKTILHEYASYNLEIIEDDLFSRLCDMIADILAACLTNIPKVVIMKCHESAIEKRESSVMAAIDLLGQTTEIIKKLETRELPNMDLDKMGFIDGWRLHLKQPSNS